MEPHLIQKVYKIEFKYKRRLYSSIITEDLISNKINIELIMDEKKREVIENDEKIYHSLEKIIHEKIPTIKKR